MIETIYVETAVKDHPRVKQIFSRFPTARIIECGRYGEVFNPKAQNFRVQKQKPALILAEKYQNFALPAPEGYGVGARFNFYFSHMLNCLYDCRYCFLQGMYQSANYVLFVNYEDFQQEIQALCSKYPQRTLHFFSGYDCDSLALEPVTDFAREFLPFFDRLPNAWLELRTKSTQIRSLLDYPLYPRSIVAFSLSPEPVAVKLEHKAPNLNKRLEAMVKLQQRGWLIGLRFDPLIYQDDYKRYYFDLFQQVFSVLDVKQIHSISYGNFRLPEKYYKKIYKLYPKEKLFAGPLALKQGMYSYTQALEHEMMDYCEQVLSGFVAKNKLFPCVL